MIEDRLWARLHFKILGFWPRSVVAERINYSLLKDREQEQRIQRIIAEGGNIYDILRLGFESCGPGSL